MPSMVDHSHPATAKLAYDLVAGNLRHSRRCRAGFTAAIPGERGFVPRLPGSRDGFVRLFRSSGVCRQSIQTE